MTTDKDCKRLIRDRMSKTGESYTSARSIVLAKSGRFGGSPALPTAAAPGQWADLTGISDASVRVFQTFNDLRGLAKVRRKVC